MLFLYMMIDDPDDRKSFERFYKKYTTKVYSIAMSIIKNEQLAEDAAANTFFYFAKNYDKIKSIDKSKIERYIYIVSKNKAFDILKAERRGIEMMEYNDEIMLTNEFLSEYDKIYLRDCIRKLNYQDREILYLFFSCGLDYKIIAETIGITQAAVRKRMQYAKSRLKSLLETEGC